MRILIVVSHTSRLWSGTRMCRSPSDDCRRVVQPEKVNCAEWHVAVSMCTYINRYHLTTREARASSAQLTTRELDLSPAPANLSAYDAEVRRLQRLGQKWIQASFQEVDRSHLLLRQQ
ncbi:uncharacterized protein ACO6RY_18941 [Pungitius sinensis]